MSVFVDMLYMVYIVKRFLFYSDIVWQILYRVTYDDLLLSARNFLKLEFNDYTDFFSLLQTPRDELYTLFDVTGHILQRLDSAFNFLLSRPVLDVDLELVLQNLRDAWSSTAGGFHACFN